MPLNAPSIKFARPPEESSFSRARELAREIEALLGAASPAELESTGYGARIAQGLARSLVDQLGELHRGPSSSRRRVPAVGPARRDNGVA